jgi:DNA-binding IclR family transcriptional regulator
MSDKKQGEISSISRSAKILFCLSKGMNSLTEIANYCKFDKPTVRRLLKALEVAELAIQDPASHLYYLGRMILLFNLHPRNSHRHLVNISMEEMKRLSDIFEETLLLGIHSGIQLICLNSIPSEQELRVVEDIYLNGSGLFPTSMDRVLLSQHEDEEIEKILPLVPGKEQLLKRIKFIRQRGYEVSYREIQEGIMGICFSISNYSQPAALGMVGPTQRLKSRELEMIKEIGVSTKRISNNLVSL